MKAEERRRAIASALSASRVPISGGEMAKRYDVSRQIIVQDVAVLRGSGYEILSTHDGYVMQKTPLFERVFKVWHTKEQTEDELDRIVALGGTVVDVFVWHKVYGKIEATLNIFSPMHVKQFIEGVRSGKSTELMSITGGYHYHTVRAESEAILDEIEAMLSERGYTVPEI